MPTKILTNFKNRRFLRLKSTVLTDGTLVFSIKNHRFFGEKSRNKAYFCFRCFLKTLFLPCEISKSSFLIFYFAKNREYDFS